MCVCVCVFTGCAAVRYYAADGSEQNLLDDYLLTAVRRNAFSSNHFHYEQLNITINFGVYQDRLGTTIGKAENKRCVFSCRSRQ